MTGPARPYRKSAIALRIHSLTPILTDVIHDNSSAYIIVTLPAYNLAENLLSGLYPHQVANGNLSVRCDYIAENTAC